MTRAHGFTLVETLLAMVILAVTLTVSMQLLITIAGLAERVQQATVPMPHALQWWVTSVEAADARGSDRKSQRLSWEGSPVRLHFHSLRPRPMAFDLRTGEMHWRLQSEGESTLLQLANRGSDFVTLAVLPKAVRFAFRDEEGRWWNAWPEHLRERLPQAIALRGEEGFIAIAVTEAARIRRPDVRLDL